MDYSRYKELKIRRLEPGILELVMGEEGGKLSTATAGMHKELAEIWLDVDRDPETRVAILQKKAQAKRLTLPPDVALFVASHVSSNVRELEGSLTRLEAEASLSRSPITLDFARQALRNLVKEKGKEVSIETVQRAVCKYFGVRVADLNSTRRTNLVSFPRQVAMFLCRKLASASYPMIGMRFGGKDHTTVLYACSTIEKRLKRDEELRAIIDRIERTIYGRCS